MAGGLATLELDEGGVVRWNDVIQHERLTAMADLLENNHFVLRQCPQDGPFHLRLAIVDGRLNMQVEALDGALVEDVTLPLTPLRNHVKEYFAVCEAFYSARQHSQPGRLEAIDMGRRGLHDEAAQLLALRLSDRVELDHATARRLFTLICVLHLRELV